VDSVAVPQHLDLDDVLVWGLTAIDLLCAVAGCGTGWWLVLRMPDALVLQLAVGAPPALIGLALGLVRIGGSPLRSWLAVALRYAIRPKVLVA
jgi:hypothetical protein